MASRFSIRDMIALLSEKNAKLTTEVEVLESQLANANGQLIAAKVICEQTEKIEAARSELKHANRKLTAVVEAARELRDSMTCNADGNLVVKLASVIVEFDEAIAALDAKEESGG